MYTPSHSRATPAAVMLIFAMALAGCSHQSNTVDLGVKRLVLDLAFKDQSKAAAAPSVSQIVAAQQPAAPVSQLFASLQPPAPSSKSTIATLAPPTCPTAPANALPDQPATGIVGTPPLAGIYPEHNHGTFTLDGPLKLKGPYPPQTAMEIVNVKDETAPDPFGQPVRTISYDVVERTPLATTTTSYASTTTELDLVSVATTANGQTTTFTPTPAITMMQYKGEGAFWKSAGIDQSTGTSMLVQGSIDKRENVDVCGKVFDSYRVISSEQVTNVGTGYNSQTPSDDPNVYNIATQLGGLMIRQHLDTVTTFTTNGAQSTLQVINTSTVDTTKPFPLKSH